MSCCKVPWTLTNLIKNIVETELLAAKNKCKCQVNYFKHAFYSWSRNLIWWTIHLLLFSEYCWGFSMFHLYGEIERCTPVSSLLQALLFQLHQGKLYDFCMHSVYVGYILKINFLFSFSYFTFYALLQNFLNECFLIGRSLVYIA